MKKITVFILLPLCLLACATVDHSPSGNSVPTPPTNGVETFSAKNLVTVTWSFANIRSGIGNDYPIVKFVKQGDKLRVIGASGDWFNIRLENGEQGWISNRVVK